MMLSSLTIFGRFFLIASLIFSLCRSWSTSPLRCRDQSCRETDEPPPELVPEVVMGILLRPHPPAVSARALQRRTGPARDTAGAQIHGKVGGEQRFPPATAGASG